MKKYIIQSVINLGYWDSDRKDFRGYYYATEYFSKEAAEMEALDIADVVTVIPIYLKK